MRVHLGVGLVLILAILLSGCTTFEAGKEYGAVAVWQNNSTGDWDTYYSFWDDEEGKWYNLENTGAAAPIAVLQGNDYDPDVYSTKNMAVAVWSHYEGGSSDIYFSVYNGLSWSTPTALAAMPGNDLDPTVAMNDGSVLVVWVNDSGGKREHQGRDLPGPDSPVLRGGSRSGIIRVDEGAAAGDLPGTDRQLASGGRAGLAHQAGRSRADRGGIHGAEEGPT